MDKEDNIMTFENIRRADEILLGFFNIKRYPLRQEKRQMAELAGVTLQYVINFFYHTRNIAKKIEDITGRKHIYKLKPCSIEIEPIDDMFINDSRMEKTKWFYYSNKNSLYSRMDTGPKKKYSMTCQILKKGRVEFEFSKN